MTEELLNDEQFIKIQQLNSSTGSERRNSMIDQKDVDQLNGKLSDSSDSSTSISGSEMNENDKDQLHQLSNIINSVSSSAKNQSTSSGSSTTTTTTTSKKPIIPTEDDENDNNNKKNIVVNNINATTTTISQNNSKINHIKLEIAKINGKEKTRFHRDSHKLISFFDDVDFDVRPSLIDGAMTEPFKSSFEGPILEKQIKAFEKNKKAHLSDHFEIDKVSTPNDYNNNSNKLRLESNFSGIYIMLWMVLGFTAGRGILEYYVGHDGSFRDLIVLKIMVNDIPNVIIFDGLMILASYFVVIIQYFIKAHVLKWDKLGEIIASLYEFAFFLVFNYKLFDASLGFHWIARIFLYLHSMVLIMKMHSFSFFNGYLWNITKELNFSKKALTKYKDAPNDEIIKTLERSRDFCEHELKKLQIQIDDPSENFPNNITFKSYTMFLLFPTLVYQLSYPRSKKFRISYLFEKTCAVFGTIFVMTLVAELYVYPSILKADFMREHFVWPPTKQQTLEWFYILFEVMPPFTVLYILAFYLIWDAILNAFAEMTFFGDRYFYGDWWNCITFIEFSRIWNVPVHKFLLRHVYHSSMNVWKLTRAQATMFTFIFSSIFHEYAMFVIFKRVRCYMFLFQMSQLPMAWASNSRLLKDKKALGNVLFWGGVCSGPSVILALYLFY
ncbi:sterol acyltransferase NDAI_0I00520 [Naumovozyma dairenensis CBS 421]|uniref:O-acyltransferase n=1 Tax=Naumovozyma dairenensis (strain ATCC 10597 / BCRC 20456 / CBS 421 / NBRC 0211 / NRRL Y-12639) TaxID=1071378 RepID=G0WFR0_NAUDC|nr:hypothetical protein NDAI_0I00520 [Naumovozyma dairenensis CBS 421]CCD26621.1 hypothetical protein NDAI_0I00520 [Naumovozyma dairenensis CBS 421]